MTTHQPSVYARRSFFNTVAETWKSDVSPEDERFLKNILHFLKTPEAIGKRVLDIGCGTGILFPFYEGWEVTALDVSDQMLQQAKKRRASHVKKFVCCDAQKLPFQDEFFARVVMLSTLPHLDDPARTLKEVFRVLKRQGTLSIIHLRNAATINAVHAARGGAIGADLLPELSDLIAILTDIGFEICLTESEERFTVLCRKP